MLERQTRYALTVYLEEKRASLVNQAVQELCRHYPIHSITADNGAEFSSLSQLEGITVYFAIPILLGREGVMRILTDFLESLFLKEGH